MKKTAVTLSIALALGLLAACDGSQAKQDQSPAPIAVGSIEGVVLKDGQGQFHVGGVPLDTSGAMLTINGKQRPIGDLQPGMTVEARGSMGGGSGSGGGMGCGMGDNGQRFRCSSVTVNSILVGAVESIDAENKTLVVAGMTVATDASTFIVRSGAGGIGAGCAPIALDALNVGDSVNICGALQQDGSILASRICLLPAGTPQEPSFTTQGTVSGLDQEAKTFLCNGFAVNYADAVVTGALLDGAWVVASGAVANGIINAVSVTVQDVVANKVVSGLMSCLDQDACRFTLSGGGCCGSVDYLVGYSDAKVGIDLATHQGRVSVQGVVTQNGNVRGIKATWITK